MGSDPSKDMALGTLGSADMLKELKESLTCSLCMNLFSCPRALPCLHVYCEACLKQHIEAATNNNMIKCPLCCVDFSIPSDGIEGFRAAFHQGSQVERYHKLNQMEYSSVPLNLKQTQANNNYCKFHDQVLTQFCETCNQLICEVCSSVPHKSHHKIMVASALEKHRSILVHTRNQMADQRDFHEKRIQETLQAVTSVNQQKTEGLLKINKQQDEMVNVVKDHCCQLTEEIIQGCETACRELHNLSATLESERNHLHECLQHLDACLRSGSDADIIKTSIEDTTIFRGTLKELGKDYTVPHFCVRVDCPRATVVGKDQVATVECRLERGAPRTNRVIDLSIRPPTLVSRKVKQFNVDFKPIGVSFTPTGNIVLSQFKGQRVGIYTTDGWRVVDLRTPFGTEAWDVESTACSLYVTDRTTESVLVFDHYGSFVTSIKTGNMKRISGISKLQDTLYVTGAETHSLYEIELSRENKYSTPFATGIRMDWPLYVCAHDDSIAISSNGDNCVQVTDLQGILKYTYGTLGQKGDGPNQLYRPRGVTFDSHNRLLIADGYNHRVCIVSEHGTYLGHIDLNKDELSYPHGLAINSQGHVIVTCYDPQCVVTYEYNFE